MCRTECGLSNADHIALTGRQLQVHRTTPGSVYSAEPGVCVTLCAKCHAPKPKSRLRSGRSDGCGGYVLTIPVSADLRNKLSEVAVGLGLNAIAFARMILILEVERYRDGPPPRV
jgi:hypothetical protein